MPYKEVPAFVTRLREREAVAARALEFTILTAARSGEVLGMIWAELDLDAKLWVVPGARMKAGREHRVPLSDQALNIIEKVAPLRVGDKSDA
jgi:integrase